MVTISDKAKAMNALSEDRVKLCAQAIHLNERAKQVHEQFMKDMRDISQAQREVLERMAEIESFLTSVDNLKVPL